MYMSTVFLSKKWHFDQIFNEILVHRIMEFGYKISFQLIDKGNIEVIGPKSIGDKFSDISTKISNFHSGLLFFYLFVMVCFIILFLTFSFSFYYQLFCFQSFSLFFLIFFAYILFFK